MRLTAKQARAAGIEPGPPRKAKSESRAKIDVAARQRLFLAACEAHGLPEPVAEYEWCPGRKFKADWCFSGLVLLEIHGGTWIGGHHSRGKDQIEDFWKINESQLLGFVYLIVTPQQVDSGEAFALVRRALGDRS